MVRQHKDPFIPCWCMCIEQIFQLWRPSTILGVKPSARVRTPAQCITRLELVGKKKGYGKILDRLERPQKTHTLSLSLAIGVAESAGHSPALRDRYKHSYINTRMSAWCGFWRMKSILDTDRSLSVC